MRTPVRRAVAEVWTNHVGVDPTWTAQQTEAFFDQEAQRLSDRINVLSAEAGPTAVAEWTRVNGRTPVGLVRRVENMVGDTPNYRDELNRRHEHALTRIGELEAVADEPFEHTDTLRDKRHRLDTLTAALQTSADSPEAKAEETEHQQRMDAQGREPGWSLALNPTPALRAEFGDAELAHRGGHGGGDSDTRGLVGAGVGAGPGDPAAGQGSSGVPRAVRLAYRGQGNPNTAPIGRAEDVLGRRRPRPQPEDRHRPMREGGQDGRTGGRGGGRSPPTREHSTVGSGVMGGGGSAGWWAVGSGR